MSHKHSQFIADQPKEGEIVLTCGHNVGLLLPGQWHWFQCGSEAEPEHVERIDERTGEKEEFTSRWIALCQECFRRFADPGKAVRDHVVWRGNAPAIKKVIA